MVVPVLGLPSPSASSRPVHLPICPSACPYPQMPKWKAQSEQLRQAMAANKRIADAAARGVDIKVRGAAVCWKSRSGGPGPGAGLHGMVIARGFRVPVGQGELI